MTSSQKAYMTLGAVIVGILIVAQWRSLGIGEDLLLRENSSDSYQEISLLKSKNEDLEKEVRNLEENIEQLSDQSSALEVIDQEIEKYKKLSGLYAVFGPGLRVEISDISTPWVVDMVNGFFSAGAEAVAVNGIRLSNNTAGFDTLPQGQILINGSILKAPYVFEAIGEPSVLSNVVELPGGIFSRFVAAFPASKIRVEKKEIIKMN